MATILSGLVGGLVATIVMTVFMMTFGDDSPPPTAAFWAKYVGDGTPDDYMQQGMLLHMLYGTIAGVVLVFLAPVVGLSLGGLTAGLIAGIAYGVVLFIGAAVFWMKIVLDIDAEPIAVGLFLLFHLVYGVVLGAWLGLGILG